MSAQLPEATLDRRNLEHFVSSLHLKLLDFEVIEVKYLGDDLRFSALDGLFAHLRDMPPLKRSKILINFRYRRNTRSTKKTTGTIYLGINQEHSRVDIGGGSRAQQSEEAFRILEIFSRFKRSFTSKLSAAILAPSLLVIFFIVNYSLAPERIVAGTGWGTFFIAVASLPIIMYVHYRPHIFISLRTWDWTDVFPGFFKILLISIFWIALTWSIIQSPKWLERDDRMVAGNPQLQREILRQALTPEILEKVESLRETNALYDRVQSLVQKKNTAEILTKQIFAIVDGNNGLNKFPIGDLAYFLSSANSMQSGNWLAEPLLLMTQVQVVNGEILPQYKPHIDSDLTSNKKITFRNWLNEAIIKDKYGRVWTRKSLLQDKVSEIDGRLSGEKLNDLRRLRTFPDQSIVFKSFSGKESANENTIESDTIRAIGEELIRSMNIIQQKLSEDPKPYSP